MSPEGLEPLASVWKTDSLPLTYKDYHPGARSRTPTLLRLKPHRYFCPNERLKLQYFIRYLDLKDKIKRKTTEFWVKPNSAALTDNEWSRNCHIHLNDSTLRLLLNPPSSKRISAWNPNLARI